MRNFLIVLSLCFFSFIAAGAQENLAIAQIFNSGYAKRQDVEEIAEFNLQMQQNSD